LVPVKKGRGSYLENTLIEVLSRYACPDGRRRGLMAMREWARTVSEACQKGKGRG